MTGIDDVMGLILAGNKAATASREVQLGGRQDCNLPRAPQTLGPTLAVNNSQALQY